jgi:hypothetical protein
MYLTEVCVWCTKTDRIHKWRAETTQNIFSEHNGIRPEVNVGDKKISNPKKLNNMLINNSWVKEEW